MRDKIIKNMKAISRSSSIYLIRISEIGKMKKGRSIIFKAE